MNKGSVSGLGLQLTKKQFIRSQVFCCNLATFTMTLLCVCVCLQRIPSKTKRIYCAYERLMVSLTQPNAMEDHNDMYAITI